MSQINKLLLSDIHHRWPEDPWPLPGASVILKSDLTQTIQSQGESQEKQKDEMTQTYQF